MKRLNYFIAIACTVLFAACTKAVNPVESVEVHEISINAVLPTPVEADETKATSVSEVIRLEWAKDDEISVINATKNKLLGGHLKAEAKGTNVKFTGSVSGTIAKDDKLVFIYPAFTKVVNEEAFGEKTLTGLATQDNKANPFVAYAAINAGTSGSSAVENVELTFVYANSFVTLNMAGLDENAPVGNVTISNVGTTCKMTVSSSGVSLNTTAGTITVGSTGNTNARGAAAIRFAMYASNAASRTVTVLTKELEWTGDPLEANKSYNSVVTAGGVDPLEKVTDKSRPYPEGGYGIKVGSLYWAPINCGYHNNSGTEGCNGNNHKLGLLFQWGAGSALYNGAAKAIYYNETKPSDWVTGSSGLSGTTSDTWNNENQGPCPFGWRLPTSQEFKNLLDLQSNTSWTTSGSNKLIDGTNVKIEYITDGTGVYAGVKGYNGIKVTQKADNTVVFFPAAGYRNDSNGSASSIGTNGNYWSSNPYSATNAYNLYFNSSYLNPADYNYRTFGFSVRCVQNE